MRPIIDAVQAGSSNAAPVFAIALPDATESLALLNAGGVPSFRTVESCADVLSLIANETQPAKQSTPVLPPAAKNLLDRNGDGVLNEVEAGEVFSALGIRGPAQIVVGVGEPMTAPLPFDYPVVAKLLSAGLPHKTEYGAITVGIGSPEELERVIAEMKAKVAEEAPKVRIDGILVQKMTYGLCEVLIGLTRDPCIGPMVTVGMGGTLAEIYRDASVRPAPVTETVAGEMLEEVRGFEVLRGYRGAPPGDMAAIIRAVSAVSSLAIDERVAEAEINPLLVSTRGQGAVLLDALIRLS